MLVLCLLTCIVPRAFSAQTKVVPSFTECKEFFYKGKEPRGMDQNADKICQMLENSERSYYATLYSPSYKIPLYSAYTLDPACPIDPGRSQISKPPRDFSGTIYDTGLLNPSSFQCDKGRAAVSTTTNAVPIDACFSRDHWKNWERTLRGYLLKELVRDGDSAKAFIVTGTVPDPNVRLPDKDNRTVPSHIWTAVCYKHNNNDTNTFSFGYIGKNQPVDPDIRLMSVSDLNDELSRLYSKLSGTDQSVDYTRRSRLVDLDIHLIEIPDLNDEFRKIYSKLSGTDQSVDYIRRKHLARHGFPERSSWPRRISPLRTFYIFDDACLIDEDKLKEVIEEFKKLIDLPVYQAVQTSAGIQDTHLSVNRDVSSKNTSANNNNIRMSEMTVRLAFDSMSTYYNVAEDVKVVAGRACLVTNAKPVEWEVSTGSDAVECLLVPEKQRTAVDGSPCSGMSESDYICQCNTGGETKPCCSSPCLYQDDLKGYRCYSDQKLIECSPRYSRITHKGKKCLDDHPCATYGKDYYWCKTADSQDFCSPPLRSSKTINGKYCRINHACAKYGSGKTWCYTDEIGNYDQCCTSDDCYSAVNGQTCRSGHRCGYHNKNYLWCYTDDQDNWDYCCTNCG